MVKINKIYTRTGDDGTTGLVSGARVPKTSLRVVAYGTVDEANAAIGTAIVQLRTADHSHSKSEQLAAQLTSIQHDLFDLGADLATPPAVDGALRILPAQVDQLESVIDAWNEGLTPLTSFVLPGGTASAAALHLARTITRRAERKAVEVFAHEGGLEDDQPVLRYLNRLSDLLFVMARIANDSGRADVLWVPGNSRPKLDQAHHAGTGGEGAT